MYVKRIDTVEADFVQIGSAGQGRIHLFNTPTTEAVPSSVRLAGSAGVPVALEISGSALVVKHELGGELFTAELTVIGDQMVGRIRHTPVPVYLKLTRAPADGEVRSEERLGRVKTDASKEENGASELSSQVTEARSLADKATTLAETASSVAQQALARAEEAGEKAAQALAKVDETKANQPLAKAEEAGDRPSHPEAGRDGHSLVASDLVESAVVTFGFDKWDLDDAAKTVLLDVIDLVKAVPDLMVDLEGYTDSVGTQKYNIELSQRRVEAVRRFLVEKGVELSRIHSVGLGPLPDSGKPQEQAKNRRVTLKLMTINSAN